MDFAFISHGAGSVDLALAFNRVAVGAFFAISGYHKLFNAARHKTMRDTLVADGVPLVRVNEWLVPSVEFLAGLALVIGVLSALAALGLFCVCCVATAVDGLRRIPSWSPIDACDWLDDLLYLPEVLYALMLLVVLVAGPGRFSLDHFVF